MRRISSRSCIKPLIILTLLCFAHQSFRAQASIEIVSETIKSKVLNEDREILISTPENYGRRSKETFPILFVTDANEHMTIVASIVRELAREGLGPDMIVVGILQKDRVKDLTPTQNQLKQSDGSIRFPTSGGAGAFLSFLESEVIPSVDRKYRTNVHRFLGGHSLGGLFAINALISHPGLFKGVLAISPSMQWDNEVMNCRVAEIFTGTRRNPSPKELLYISLGNEQGPIKSAFSRFQKTLSDNWPERGWKSVQIGEDHDAVVKPSYREGLVWMFADWNTNKDKR